MRVLVVEDNPAIRGAVRELFESDPTFQLCGEAENGREAIQKTAELRPELIIMDLSMPVLNGLDAARGIRRIKQAKVGALTALAFVADHRSSRTLSLGQAGGELKVRFARGTARTSRWCEVQHRVIDWASAPLHEESEVVIMIAVVRAKRCMGRTEFQT